MNTNAKHVGLLLLFNTLSLLSGGETPEQAAQTEREEQRIRLFRQEQELELARYAKVQAAHERDTKHVAAHGAVSVRPSTKTAGDHLLQRSMQEEKNSLSARIKILTWEIERETARILTLKEEDREPAIRALSVTQEQLRLANRRYQELTRMLTLGLTSL